ncbi:MAG: hypothetical protein A2498_02700 [Lentisphaerae bacterium RIFOXYC12_FULL_60_16]|nr:MAG: hypothetical protein A2498_02700 [Lentisphaerae bacterium RIFOXYC12_FULL_60_16]
MKFSSPSPVYCSLSTEFIQPWDHDAAIRRVAELGLGNMIILQNTFHVGNSAEARRKWKELYPHLAEKVDATPLFPERPKHGMAVLFNLPIEFYLDQMRLCRELGLKVFMYIPSRLTLSPEDFRRLGEAGKDLVLMDMIMGENLSILGSTVSIDRLKALDATPIVSHAERDVNPAVAASLGSIFDDPDALNFQTVHDWFVARFRKAGEQLRAQGATTLGGLEASSQIRLCMEAGVDIPILELVPHEPLRGLASVRGAAKAWGKPLWGMHTAMGYYRPPTDRWTPERLRIAYNLFFAGGCGIFTECNLPLRNTGSCSGFFSIRASPPIRAGEEECLEFDDPVCARAREVVADHYRFTQFHRRPARGPRVRMGFVLGHLDAWAGASGDRMWMVDQPGFLAKDAIDAWHHLDRVFDSEPWYEAPRKYYWMADPGKPLRHGTPPCGQVDLVPIEAPSQALAGYGSLAFLGWNTMTAEHYARLLEFVKGGGQLFMSVPHFSTRTRTDQPPAFFRGGDLRELCGARVLGRGDAIEEVYLAQNSANPRCVFPQGTLYLEPAVLARLDLHGARVLAHPRGRTDQPVLIEHRVGKGCVYLLATWDYPGMQLDAFITDILRTLAESEQADIAVCSRDVIYSIYDGTMPSGQAFSTVYLASHDLYGQTAYPELLIRSQRIPVRVGGRDLRIAWVIGDLVIAPHDRYVKVTDAKRNAGGWRITIESIPTAPSEKAGGDRVIQVEAVKGAIRKITLQKRSLPIMRRIEGDHAVIGRFDGKQTIQVELR